MVKIISKMDEQLVMTNRSSLAEIAEDIKKLAEDLYEKQRSVDDDKDGIDKIITGLNTLRKDVEYHNASAILLTEAFQSTAEALLVVDKNHIIIHISQPALDLFGFSKAAVIGQPLSRTLSEAPPGKLSAPDISETNLFPSKEIQLEMKAGMKGSYSGFVTAVRDEDEQIIGKLFSFKALTKKKQPQDDFLSTAKFNQRIVNESPVGMYRTTPEGDIIDMNPALYKMLGFSSLEELQNRNLEEEDKRTQSYGRKKFKDEIEENGKIHGYESEWLTANNEKIFVVENAHLVLDDIGDVLYYEGTAVNISKRKLIEEELLRSERSLREAQRIAHLGNWEYDASKGTIYCSEEVYSLLGYQPDEVIPTFAVYLEKVHPVDKKYVTEAFQNVSKFNNPFEVTHRLCLDKGIVKWVKLFCEIHFDDKERMVRSIGTIQDITKQHTTATMLEESESKLRSYVENAPNGIFITEATGNILEVNGAAIAITGYTPAELQMMCLHEIMQQEDGNSIEDLFIAAAKAGKVSGEMLYHTKDNSSGTLIVDMVKLEQNLFLVFVTNITERKALEVQLRQAQKLEAIGIMAAGIAHDFNNILQSQFLYAGLIEKSLPDDEKLKANFQQILKSGEQAGNLVQQILTFSQPAGEDFTPIRIQDILFDMLELVQASLPNNIELRQDIDMTAHPVMGEQTQMQQIILNLCNNARQAIEGKDGLLLISAKEIPTQEIVELDGLEVGSQRVIELRVGDNGIGMDEATTERIFDPFYTTKDIGQGTGLGLAVVYGIVKKMNGHILISSNIGYGSLFKIWFPVIEDSQMTKSLPKEDSDMHSSPTILILDE